MVRVSSREDQQRFVVKEELKVEQVTLQSDGESENKINSRNRANESVQSAEAEWERRNALGDGDGGASQGQAGAGQGFPWSPCEAA